MIFECFYLQRAAKQCIHKIIKIMLEQLTKMVPKQSQNLSEINPGGALEATWEPPLKQGASKTSFLMMLVPYWDPPLEPLGSHVGHHFLNVFSSQHGSVFNSKNP